MSNSNSSAGYFSFDYNTSTSTPEALSIQNFTEEEQTDFDTDGRELVGLSMKQIFEKEDGGQVLLIEQNTIWHAASIKETPLVQSKNVIIASTDKSGKKDGPLYWTNENLCMLICPTWVMRQYITKAKYIFCTMELKKM